MEFETAGIKIEFIGGPFDGFGERREMGPDQLPVNVVWFVGGIGDQNCGGGDGMSPGKLSSVALYERDLQGDTCRYRFVKAFPVREVLEDIDAFVTDLLDRRQHGEAR